MIPSYIKQIDRIPLTPNGKIDRKALPDPTIEVGEEYVAPRNKTEEILVEIWRDVLGVEGIGIGDNFFEVGGDSIKAIQIASRIRKYGLKIEVGDLFASQTIGEISKRVKVIEREIDQGVVEGGKTTAQAGSRSFGLGGGRVSGGGNELDDVEVNGLVGGFGQGEDEAIVEGQGGEEEKNQEEGKVRREA